MWRTDLIRIEDGMKYGWRMSSLLEDEAWNTELNLKHHPKDAWIWDGRRHLGAEVNEDKAGAGCCCRLLLSATWRQHATIGEN
jgi:hypothetical protein